MLWLLLSLFHRLQQVSCSILLDSVVGRFQVESLETAMDPRFGSELAGAYGRQVYGSLGPMLRQAQATSSELAQKVQVGP